MPSEPVRLRDRQRQETLRRIGEAACELAAESGIENLKAGAIAARAGISRRTFFNYVSTTDAALGLLFEDFWERARAEFGARKPSTSALDDVIAAILAAADAEFVERLARMSRIAAGSDAYARFERSTWERGEQAAREFLIARYADPLCAEVHAAAIIAAGRVGAIAWAAAIARRQKENRPARVVEFRGFLLQAFGCLKTIDPTTLGGMFPSYCLGASATGSSVDTPRSGGERDCRGG